MPDLKIAPSLLSCNFASIASEIADVERFGVELLHVDVMDGHFVPNITIGPPVVKSIKKAANTPLDVHLMITDPWKYADPFIDAGADILTFHIEAVPEPRNLFERIRARGTKTGIVVSPDTKVQKVMDFGGEVDMILIMSVHPGFGGQKFISNVLRKVEALRDRFPSLDIEIDGGIGPKTAGDAFKAGANVLVAGSAIFSQPDRGAAIDAIRKAALGGK
ncbi:MAG: ribulose-phosphate 3-epimerase [Planctomycetes bacterium]|nr:ribulose-phosphate 3-epimerase [Planctomycetota bacterium]